MNRSDLVESLSKSHDLPRRTADAVVGQIFDCISDAILSDERVEIRGFGSFTTRHYGPYTGRNPRTGRPVSVESKRLPYFKVGKELRERVDGL
jgi:integration host factor subunit beta